jgi:hypothetical protein
MQQFDGTFALSWSEIQNLDPQTHDRLLKSKIAALDRIRKAGKRGPR